MEKKKREPKIKTTIILGKWRFTKHDELNWETERLITSMSKKTGLSREKWDHKYWYPYLADALKDSATLEADESLVQTFQDYAETLRQILQRFRDELKTWEKENIK